MEVEQRNYHNWENGKRKEAIGVIITLPKSKAHLFKEMNVVFVGKDFTN